MAKTDSWQTPSAAAAQVGCTRQNIHGLIKTGKIRAIRIYGSVFVPFPLDYQPDRKRQKAAKQNA